MAAKDLTGTDPEFARRYTAGVAAIRSELGIDVQIVSGYRSFAEQQYLYDGWINRRPGFNPAAKPGTSNHNFGLALDITPNSDQAPGIIALFARYGLHFPLRHLPSMHEPWHLEPLSARGRPMPPMPETAPRPAPDPSPAPTTEDPHMSAQDVAALKAHIDDRFRQAGVDQLRLTVNAANARGILGGYVAPNGAIYAISTDADGRLVRLGFRDHGRQGSAQEDIEALKATGVLPDPLPQPDPATPLGRMQLAGLNRIPEIPYRLG